jgi:hypothetical protein
LGHAKPDEIYFALISEIVFYFTKDERFGITETEPLENTPNEEITKKSS